MLFGGIDLGGLKEPRIWWGPDTQWEWAILGADWHIEKHGNQYFMKAKGEQFEHLLWLAVAYCVLLRRIVSNDI